MTFWVFALIGAGVLAAILFDGLPRPDIDVHEDCC